MDFKMRLKTAKIKHKDIATCLGVSNNTVTRMVDEPGLYISLNQAFKIRNQFFSSLSLDEVFGQEHMIIKNGGNLLVLNLNENELQVLKRLIGDLSLSLETAK